jgi:diacylglycerol kinase family enzyme
MTKLYAGTHTTLNEVKVVRAKQVQASVVEEGRMRIDLDGEAPGYLPASWSIIPASIDFLV